MTRLRVRAPGVPSRAPEPETSEPSSVAEPETREQVDVRAQQRVAAWNLQVEAELLRLLDAFAAQTLPVAVLKGTPRARALHGHLGARALGDNDLLVRRRDVPRAHAVLRDLGYNEPAPWRLETALRTSHEYPMWKDTVSGRVSVDLHWRALEPLLYPLAEADVWRRFTEVVLRGRRLLVPEPSLALLLGATQLVLHGVCEPTRARELLAAWSQASPGERTEARALARRAGAEPTLLVALAVAQGLTAAGVPERLADVPEPSRPLDRLLVAWLLRPARHDELGRLARHGVPLLLVSPSHALRSALSQLWPPVEQASAARPGAGVFARFAPRAARLLRLVPTLTPTRDEVSATSRFSRRPAPPNR